MSQTNELTNETTIVNGDKEASKSTKISEYVIPGEDLVVRYTRSIPDAETFHDLIGIGKKIFPPYLSAAFTRIDGETDVVFGDARIHYEIVRAIEHEQERKVDDWIQVQIDIDKELVKLGKIGLKGGFGETEENLRLLLGRINPQLFIPQEIPIRVWTTYASYIYNPLSRELKEEIRIAGGQTVMEPLGNEKCFIKMFSKFKNKKIAVVGLGIEGFSSAKFLKEQGAQVTVLDQKREDEIDKDTRKILRESDIEILGGEQYLKNLSKYDLVVRSPGVKLELLEKYASGDKITSQTKLFFDLCPCPIIGVTGTKGKGTTSSLIYEMLRKHGLDVYLGGNIGKPPLDFLDKLNTQSKVVLELSSFQLQDLTKSPHIAIMLMTTSEHLDYHKNTHEYIDAKRNIFRFQISSDIAIINKDYPASSESDVHTQGKIYKVSRENIAQDGCYVENGKIKARTTFGKNKTRVLEIIETKDILLPGKHNLENVCAAVMAAILSGVSKESIVTVLRTFKGLEHRLELIREINGVKFYDDSFSTIPETTIAAIEAFKDPEILILGGSSKNSDFKELGRIISEAKNIKAIIGIGAEWPRIQQQLTINNSQLTIIEGLKNMREIVQKAVSISKPGDVVLLSPACASFGMFKNYKDRGNQFKEEVRRLI